MGGPVDGGRPRGSIAAGRGLAWLLQSLLLLRIQAGRLLLIAVVMQLVLGLVQVPLLGILVVLSVPALTAGILEAFKVTASGGAPSLRLLFLPLATAERRGRLLALGALVFAIGILCVSLLLGNTLANVDEATLLRLQQGDMAALTELDPMFMTRLLGAFAFSVALSGTVTFYSIPLVWFGGRRVWSAVGAGLAALLRHWKPMLVLGVALAAASLPLALAVGALLQVAAAGGAVGYIATGFVMLLLLAFQMLLFGTQYVSYREIFGSGGETPAPEPPAGDDGQLVA